MSGISLSGGELFLGGMAAFAVLAMVVKARAGAKRARAAAEIAQVGAGVVSLVGRVLITAGVIAGAQWLVITYAAANTTLLWVVLGVPALLAAYTLTKALTVTEVRPSPRQVGARR
jgi:predicted transporter